MQKIDERTDGAWRPGPGTMYPLLKGLVADGLAKVSPESRGSKTYAITPRGQKDLDEMKEGLGSLGRKERVMGRLFSDLVPASVFVPAMINRYKEGLEHFKEKIDEIPRPERDAYIGEMKVLLEAQLDWVDQRVEQSRRVRRRRKV
jgi:DNA-binding PadR family transcriptional regulator